MAKKLRDEDLVLNVIINGNKSKKEMQELDRAIIDTNKEIKQLKNLQKDLIAQGKKETEAYKATEQAIKDKNAAITLAESRLNELRSGMKMTEMNVIDLQQELKKLTQMWKLAVPESDNQKMYKGQMDAIKARINEIKDGGEETGGVISGMVDSFNENVGAIAVFGVSLSEIASGITAINDVYNEFTDKVADVQKTTGETEETVLELNDAFKEMDSRTAQEGLLDLAVVAGKLGITGKEDILGFVNAADKIGVALGEDLGDAEQAINDLGKLTDLFKIKDEYGLETALLKIGSAINSLGAAGTANEGYIVEFTKRMGTIAPAANMSITNVMGLAATMDELGQNVEASSTAIGQFIVGMGKDVPTFARVAGMSVADFSALLKKDANEALIAVLERIKSTGAGVEELAANMGLVGEDGARAVAALGALSNGLDKLRTSQSLSLEEFTKGSSIFDEFDVKNQTAAANADRVKKAIYNLTVEVGEKLSPIITDASSIFVAFIRVLGTLAGFLMDHRKIIASLLAGYIVYNATVAIQNALMAESVIMKKAEIAWSKIKVFWDTAQTAGLHLMGAAYLLVRGEVAAAKQEMILFNAVTKANPLGLWLAALAAVVVAIALYSDELSSAQKATAALVDVEAQAKKSIVEQKQELEGLLKTARDKTKTDGERLAAIKRLNEISPEYLGFLNLENINTDKATKATDKYIESLLQVARVKAAQDSLVALEKEKIDLVLKPVETTMWQKAGSAVLSIWGGTVAAVNSESLSMAKNYAKATNDIKAKSEALTAYIEKNKPKPVVNESGNADGSNGSTLTADQVKARAKYALEAKSKLEQERLAHQARLQEVGLYGKAEKDMTAADKQTLLELNKVYQDNIAAINSKGSKKAASEQARIRKKEEADAKAKAKSEKEFRQEIMNSSKSEMEQENIAHLERLKKSGIDEKNVREDQKATFEAIEKTHRAKLDALDLKITTDHLNKVQKKYDAELNSLKEKNNTEFIALTTVGKIKEKLTDTLTARELAKIKTLEQARKALRQKYDNEESKLTAKNMQELASQLQAVIKSGEFTGLNLSDKVLSEGELEIISQRLGAAKAMIAEMLAKATSGGSDDSSPAEKTFSFAGEGGKTDVLGMTVDDWDLFFSHVDAGKLGLSEMVAVVGALTGAYQIYSNFMMAAEKKQLQTFEKATDEKKAKLQSQLNSGQISQEAYNKKIAELDADLDKKKAEIELKQAKRERLMALMNIAQSTAQAIIGIWAQVPKFDFGISAGILTGVVSALGAAQAAAVLSAPLPGKEEGGFFMATREQDGKQFKSSYSPDQRGYVKKPTVLVGEGGPEFVANAEAVNNPNIRQLLDIIDTAQKNGTVNTLGMEQLFAQGNYQARVPGRQTGGYIGDFSSESSNTDISSLNPKMMELLLQLYNINKKLSEQLETPIEAEISLLGRYGLMSKMDELKKLQDSSNL